jgi:hypothetical protein
MKFTYRYQVKVWLVVTVVSFSPFLCPRPFPKGFGERIWIQVVVINVPDY